jgi:hypothetical protein
MRFNPELNMVMRLTDEDGTPFVVHSTPLPTSVFDANWMVFREAYEDMASGRSMAASIYLAKKILISAADSFNKKNDIADVLQSMASATFVISGGTPKLLAESHLSNEMKDEVISRLTFFIVFSRHTFPSMMRNWLSGILPVMNLELTSSSVMELSDSSTTTSEAEPTGKSGTSVPI